jgi:hypothetical protein
MPNIIASTTPVQVLLPETGESGDNALYIQNRGTIEVFFGPTSAVTATSGINSGVGLAAGLILEYPGGRRGGGYDIWFVTASGTAEIRWVRV